MIEQFKQAIENNSEHVPYDIVFIESAAAECERICEERMIAFAKWALIHCEFNRREGIIWKGDKGAITTAELIKIFNERQ